MKHVLIVDDEESICWGLQQVVSDLGCRATVAASAEQAHEAVRRGSVDLAIVDVRLPGTDGLSLMEELQHQGASFPFIVITAYGDLGTAVHAIQSGAFDYIPKPFDVATIELAVVGALSNRAADARGDRATELSPPLSQRLIGSSPAIQEVFKQIAKVAATDASVHLMGESGTGKELVARAIHDYSPRRREPFVVVHGAAISPTLAESELFGHVRGAFTGAQEMRAGLLEQARGGTLFLDEVGDLPMDLQVKLLRAIEYGEVVPVGSTRAVECDFRVISATHRDLRRRTAEGTFREDLYFRLVAYTIELPPLRQRVQDIRELAEHFLARLAERGGAAAPWLAEETIAELERRPWAGNVRELRNAMEHALIAARGHMVLPRDLPVPATAIATPAESTSPIEAAVRAWARTQLDGNPTTEELHRLLLELVERPLIAEALAAHEGNVTSAARQLGLHRVTLKRKIDDYGLS